MMIALDKHAGLYVFGSAEDAGGHLQAVDVQQDALEFCDGDGQRYAPVYTRQPKEFRLGPLGILDVGTFKLVPEGAADAGLPERFLQRATHIEHSSFPEVTSIETVRNVLRRSVRHD